MLLVVQLILAIIEHKNLNEFLFILVYLGIPLGIECMLALSLLKPVLSLLLLKKPSRWNIFWQICMIGCAFCIGLSALILPWPSIAFYTMMLFTFCFFAYRKLHSNILAPDHWKTKMMAWKTNFRRRCVSRYRSSRIPLAKAKLLWNYRCVSLTFIFPYLWNLSRINQADSYFQTIGNQNLLFCMTETLMHWTRLERSEPPWIKKNFSSLVFCLFVQRQLTFLLHPAHRMVEQVFSNSILILLPLFYTDGEWRIVMKTKIIAVTLGVAALIIAGAAYLFHMENYDSFFYCKVMETDSCKETGPGSDLPYEYTLTGYS